MIESGLLNSKGNFESPLKTLSDRWILWIKNLWFWSAGVEEMAVTNKTPEPLMWNHCFAGISDADQPELRNQPWLRRDQHWRGETFWEVIPWSYTKKLCSKGSQDCTLHWQPYLVVLRPPRWYWFWRHKGVKGGPLRLGIVWQGWGPLRLSNPSCSKRSQHFRNVSTRGRPPRKKQQPWRGVDWI